MESIDRQILGLLAADGRMSYTDIGRATGLSTSAAQQRVRRLEQRGIITGYQAMIDPEAVERALTAFISIIPRDPARDSEVAQTVESIDSVTACYSVAGDASYLLKVQVRDTGELDELLTRIRTQAAVTTVTTVVLTTMFTSRPLVSAP